MSLRQCCTGPRIIRETMLTGNSLYDKHGFTDLLLADDVLEMESGIDLERSREAFVRPTELPSLVTMLRESGQASVSGRSAGIMIVAPFAFSILLGHASFFLCFSLCARIDFRQSPKKKTQIKCALRFVRNPTTKFACLHRYRRLHSYS